MPFGSTADRLLVQECTACSWDGHVRLYSDGSRRYWVCPRCLATAAPSEPLALAGR